MVFVLYGNYSIYMEFRDFPYTFSARGGVDVYKCVTIVALSAGVLLGAGCTAPRRVEPPPTSPARPAPLPPPERASVPGSALGAATEGTITAGVDHVVERGQTLWRIARVYGVDAAELSRVNDLDDTAALEVGQLLFVPGALVTRKVPPYPAPLPGEAPQAAGATGGDWSWPLDGTVVSYFGAPRRHGRPHAGVDIGGESGQTVRAARGGTVTYAGSTMRGYGKTVIVDHGDGTSSLYAHNSALLVDVGQRIEAAEPIARVGRTGNATSNHCHFEIRVGGTPIDPMTLLPAALEANSR